MMFIMLISIIWHTNWVFTQKWLYDTPNIKWNQEIPMVDYHYLPSPELNPQSQSHCNNTLNTLLTCHTYLHSHVLTKERAVLLSSSVKCDWTRQKGLSKVSNATTWGLSLRCCHFADESINDLNELPYSEGDSFDVNLVGFCILYELLRLAICSIGIIQNRI